MPNSLLHPTTEADLERLKKMPWLEFLTVVQHNLTGSSVSTGRISNHPQPHRRGQGIPIPDAVAVAEALIERLRAGV